MISRIAVGILAFSVSIFNCVAGVSADYITDRQAAMTLLKEGKHEEALAVWVNLAEAADTPKQKSDAYEQAALCAQVLKQQERAFELAKLIPISPLAKNCEMRLLENQREWQKIIDTFKDENIDTWPEGIRADAYARRGYSYYVLKHGKEAAHDFEQAVPYYTDLNSLGHCLNQLGDTYQFLLKDEDKALATYRRTYDAGNIYKICQASMSIADILQQRKEYAAALEAMNQVDMVQVEAPHWRGRMLCAMGQVLAKLGKKAEAQAKYKEALALEGLSDEARNQCEAALKK